MPRKQRIEYPGATYHIISRGDYRKDLFVQTGSGEAIVLEEMKKSGK